MEISEILVSKFDFRSENGNCFFKYCGQKAIKKIMFREFNLKHQTVKDLAEVNLCEEHARIMVPLVRELNQKSEGRFRIIRYDSRPI